MQIEGFFNSLVQTEGVSPLQTNMQPVQNGQNADEFASLLMEAEQLAGENIEPEVLMASLEEEGGNLSAEQKGLLQSVILGQKNSKSAEIQNILNPQQLAEGMLEQDALATEGEVEAELPLGDKLNNILVNSKGNKTPVLNSKAQSLNGNANQAMLNEQPIMSEAELRQVATKTPTKMTAAQMQLMQGDLKAATVQPEVKPETLNNLYVKMTPRNNSGKSSIHAVDEIINTADTQSETDLFLQNLKSGNKAQSQAMNNYVKEQKLLDETIIKNNKSDFFTTTHNMQTGEIATEASKEAQALLGNSEGVDFSNIQASGLEAAVTKAQPQTNTTQVQTKVFNMTNVDASNTAEVISKISDYVQQTSLQNREELNLVVKHDSLGQFNINVHKQRNANNVQLEIMAMAEEGHKFFVENEADLVKSLVKSGIKISDVKVLAGSESSQMNNDSKGSSSEQSMQEESKKFAGQDRNENADSQRRRTLWEQYKERMGA